MRDKQMVSKTRERLVEVARQLFLRKGVENTTMAEIANASEKGRRTVYTYFRNKREIHQAVVESESELIIGRQRGIQRSGLSASAKLEQMIRARLEILKCPTSNDVSSRRGESALSFKSLLEGTRAGKARRLATFKELEIFREIIADGVAAGEFPPAQAQRLQAVMLVLALGVDNPAATIHLASLGIDMQQTYDSVIAFILEAMRAGAPAPPSQEDNLT